MNQCVITANRQEIDENPYLPPLQVMMQQCTQSLVRNWYILNVKTNFLLSMLFHIQL